MTKSKMRAKTILLLSIGIALISSASQGKGFEDLKGKGDYFRFKSGKYYKTGKWIYYYNADSKAAEVNYYTEKQYRDSKKEIDIQNEYGILEGRCIFYYKNGNKMMEGQFSDGEKDSYWILYYNKYYGNRISAEGSFINGKPHGIWYFYDKPDEAECIIEFNTGVTKSKKGICKGKYDYIFKLPGELIEEKIGLDPIYE
jgi:hypothetical protein